MFKKIRAKVVPNCSKGRILKNKGAQPTNDCEVCGARYDMDVRRGGVQVRHLPSVQDKEAGATPARP